MLFELCLSLWQFCKVNKIPHLKSREMRLSGLKNLAMHHTASELHAGTKPTLIHCRSLRFYVFIVHLMPTGIGLSAGKLHCIQIRCLFLLSASHLWCIKANDSLCKELDIVRSYSSVFVRHGDFDLSSSENTGSSPPTHIAMVVFFLLLLIWVVPSTGLWGVSQTRWAGVPPGHDCISNSGNRGQRWEPSDLLMHCFSFSHTMQLVGS